VFYIGFDGIYYRSKYGHDIVIRALLGPFQLSHQSAAALDLEDAELQHALCIHDLQIGAERPPV
jgi:hypothetical protein